jgi:glycosyltransferase involved in cell wall biosynthesis
VYRQIYRLPDRIIVHTPAARQQLVQGFGVPPDRIRTASIGLNEEAAVTGITRAEARERLGLGSERVVLFFGKAEPYKGLDLLVRAHARPESPESTLLISCWFPGADYRRSVLDAIARSPRRDRIRLHEGFAANAEIEIFFKAADVLVLPYRHIYQSGVVFLCWRFGLPIVATDVGSLRETIEPDAGVIAPAATAEAIAGALQRFFDRRAGFRRERIAARAQRYRWEVICRDLVPLYRSSEPHGVT